MCVEHMKIKDKEWIKVANHTLPITNLFLIVQFEIIAEYLDIPQQMPKEL